LAHHLERLQHGGYAIGRKPPHRQQRGHSNNHERHYDCECAPAPQLAVNIEHRPLDRLRLRVTRRLGSSGDRRDRWSQYGLSGGCSGRLR
jgi:hypothetical protein